MSAPSPDSDDAVKMTLRLPPSLHEALVGKAEENVRSLNGEIVARLRASLERDAQESGS